MGYDVTFHLVDGKRVRDELVPALAEGRQLPESAFDERNDADEIIARVRAAIADADAAEAANLACQFVLIWSASELPHVWTRNLAITYRPLRMEEELGWLPNCGLGSPEGLFGALHQKRPDLDFPSTLTGNYETGGFAWSPEVHRLRTRYEEFEPPMRSRILDLLALFRAAQRHGLQVWEASDLADLNVPGDQMLWWPGLERFGLHGPKLSDDEWKQVFATNDSWARLASKNQVTGRAPT